MSETTRPDLEARAQLDRLAALFATPDGARSLVALQKARLVLDPVLATAPADADATTGDAPTVGIWQRTPDGSFRRRARDRAEWHMWADVEVLPRKGPRPRVLWVGESVARGYFLDPEFTPARALEARFGGRIEVIDLARTDLDAVGLVSILIQGGALEPDAIVMFAGNNWLEVPAAPDARDVLAAAIRGGGVAAARELGLESIAATATMAVNVLGLVVKAHRAYGVVVIPGFNLADWAPEPALHVPVIAPGPGGNAAWMTALVAAEEQLRRGEHDGVLRTARHMVTLDCGTSERSARLVGAALLGLGRHAEARVALEAARDAVVGTFTPCSPRRPEVARTHMRERASAHGLGMVDVAGIRGDDDGGEIAGRSLFFDYCHLTPSAVAAVVDATASTLGSHIGVEPIAGPALVPARSTQAMAHFLAAIHNAHYGQPAALLHHHAATALMLDPSVSDAMEAYLELWPRRAPSWCCTAYGRLARSPLVQRYLPAHDPRRTARLDDRELADAMLAALAVHGPRPGRRQAMVALLADADDVRIDLLEPRAYARTFRERVGYSLGARRGYFQAFDAVSTFRFERRDDAPARLSLTWRLWSGRTTGGAPPRATVVVDGQVARECELSARWTTAHVALDGRAGARVVELRWPPLQVATEQVLEAAAQALEGGRLPDVLPVFGEIHALQVD